jgi:hypothetical protein
MGGVSLLRNLLRSLTSRPRRGVGPTVLIGTDEHGRTVILPAPESLEFWRQCPWAGDDEESVRFRRIMEKEKSE